MLTDTEEKNQEFEIISRYSRQEAFEDGVLIDLSENEVAKQHFRYPVAVTAAVWWIIEKALSNKKYLNDLNGIIHDICWMSKVRAQNISETTRLFQVIIKGGRKYMYTLKMVCGPGDGMEPVLTVMMPDED